MEINIAANTTCNVTSGTALILPASESNTKPEMALKLQDYFDSGTQMVWYIDPSTRTATVYHRAGEPTRVLTEDDTLDGEQVVPGFTMAIADLFRNMPVG